MEQGVVIVLLISGLCTLCSCLSRQYHFVNIEKSWTEAQSYCRQNYVDLATIDGPEEMQALLETVDGRRHYAWIGLYDDRESWQWTLTNSSFYSEGETEFRNWKVGEPDKTGGCVTMDSEGTWTDVSCHISPGNPFVCYDDDPQRYILNTKKTGWEKAVFNCEKHYTSLTIIRNQTENKKIKDIISDSQDHDNLDVWIGLFREPWSKWSDQGVSSYRKWNSGEPNNLGGNEDCALVTTSDSGRWNDRNCDDKHSFFCYDDNLILIRVNKSWDEALSFCRQHYGDLVSVPTEQVQRSVNRMAQSASTAHVWMGLRFSCAMKFWLWLDGEITWYQNWAPGNDTRECGQRGAVESGAGQQWVSLPKTEELNFICRKCEGMCDSTLKQKHVLRMKLNALSSLNMDDPAVAEAMLQQMKVKLADEGITGVKLRWRKQADGKIFHREEEEGKEEECENMEV
ncbi:hypothetical protein AAFF_G00170770 [Aldrovandia affinis]|uniref:C-type lectin domain-containing protein n=1 Tax=Aldrovandia affinis TaxID=143900 RepID=A0AAD7RLJ7_9TELE|nr:hypothetical protein AAFF_G00170770 [Aldrovandia affinis]